jgi:hypothetical protein
MSYPHHFPSLIKDVKRSPILIIGAGLSRPMLGSTEELAETLAQKLTSPPACKAHAVGKVCPYEGKPTGNCLYCVAEARLSELEKNNGNCHPLFRLAEELGLFELQTWHGDADLLLGRNYAKHRAIARLAADGRFNTIVCLNWDCFLEAALDAVGLVRNRVNEDHPGKIGGFAVIVGDDQHPPACMGIFRLIKPHGCVINLYEQRANNQGKKPVLKITYDDLLSTVSSVNHDVTQEILLGWKGRPLITSGWSGSEPYLKDIADHIKSDCADLDVKDKLSVIDLVWQGNHDHLAMCYGTTKELSFFEVAPAGKANIDHLWMSVYTRYAIQKMRGYTADEVKEQLDAFLSGSRETATEKWEVAMQFCDDFLPSWCRLCWRLGAVLCYRNDQTQIPPNRIPLVPRDWHVPFDTKVGTAPDQRPDLRAAGTLLMKLLELSDNRWRLDIFPGGLWRKDDGLMLLPVPTFFPIEMRVDLSGLKPQIEEISRYHPFSEIQSIRLLLITAGDAAEPRQDELIIRAFSSALRQVLPLEALLPLSKDDDFKSFDAVDIGWISPGGMK